MSNALEMRDYHAKLEAEKAAQALESFVNPYGCDHDSFVKQITHRAHRTLQQSIGKLVFKLIKGWAEMYRKDMYDGRNEGICQACHNIDELMTAEHNGDWTYLPTV
ncbi:MAG: hypothetical protein DRQ46_04860 [Gammaproteobacteria bacterium]|nr:MAG: hypothetical protein DRQ46_04860 [Gammaproteobacteria bacterium]